MDIAATIDVLVPAADYGGSVTSNTREAFEAIRWDDERPKPSWDQILIASQPTYQKELSILSSEYQAEVENLSKAFSLAYLTDGPSQEAKQSSIRAQLSDLKSQYLTDLAALRAKYGV